MFLYFKRRIECNSWVAEITIPLIFSIGELILNDFELFVNLYTKLLIDGMLYSSVRIISNYFLSNCAFLV